MSANRDRFKSLCDAGATWPGDEARNEAERTARMGLPVVVSASHLLWLESEIARLNYELEKDDE